MKKWAVVISVSAYLIILFACADNVPTEDSLPNVIFILADDMGYGDSSPYGQKHIHTPNLQRLADEGMRFTQFYAGTSVCAPSRAVLMTGLHTGHVEIRGNKQYGMRNGQYPLNPNRPTLTKMMKTAGYKTAMIGKWGLGNPNTPGSPQNHDWDYFFGYTDQVLAHNYYPEYLWKNEEKVYLENKVNYLDSTAWHAGLGSYSTIKKQYSHDLFIDEALQFIEANQADPFFLYLPLTIPHDNGEQADSLRFEVPDQSIYQKYDWPRKAKDYAAMITRMDDGVGQIIAQLQSLKIEKNTLLIFTSDNGPLRNGPITTFFDSNGPLKGGKRDLYEGGIRVPFIARWPDKIPAGKVSDHVAAFWDILPTLGALTKTPIATKIDGLSMLPSLMGQSEQEQHELLYWEFHEGKGAQAIRQGKWKAVRVGVKNNPNSPIQLFDLSADLGEQRDIADQYPDKVKELEALMKSNRTESTLFPLLASEKEM